MWRNDAAGRKTLCNACGVRLNRTLYKARAGDGSPPGRAAPAGTSPTRRMSTPACPTHTLAHDDAAALIIRALGARAQSLPSELSDSALFGDLALAAPCLAARCSGSAAPVRGGGGGGGHISLTPPTARKRDWQVCTLQTISIVFMTKHGAPAPTAAPGRQLTEHGKSPGKISLEDLLWANRSRLAMPRLI